jgi:hypothetical protein
MAWIAGVPQQRAGRPARKYYNYALSRIRMANTIFVLDLYDVRINTCVFFCSIWNPASPVGVDADKTFVYDCEQMSLPIIP